MTGRDEALERLRTLHDQLGSHDEQRKQLMRQRDDALRDAQAAGATYKDIQAVTGLANAAITTALGRK